MNNFFQSLLGAIGIFVCFVNFRNLPSLYYLFRHFQEPLLAEFLFNLPELPKMFALKRYLEQLLLLLTHQLLLSLGFQVGTALM